MEHFGTPGGELERRDIGHPEPELQIVPTEIPQQDKKKFPDGIEHWPTISELPDDAPLPGESDEKRPPTIH